MRPGGRTTSGPPPLSIAAFKKLCLELWGFEPTHPETAHMAASELRDRGFGTLLNLSRWRHYGLTEEEDARRASSRKYQRPSREFLRNSNHVTALLASMARLAKRMRIPDMHRQRLYRFQSSWAKFVKGV